VAATPVAEPIPVSDARSLVRKWGIVVESLRLTASGYMLDFRYRVVDARKAKPLFERKTKPVLTDEATGAIMSVPVPPKTGALRNSNDPKAGRSYFMFFGNPAHFVKPGNTVTITIGKFAVTGVRVASDADPVVSPAPSPAQVQAPAGTHSGHEGHAMPPPSQVIKVLDPQPNIGYVSLADHEGHGTSLRAALDTDKPVLVNFIFTSCTTICPVMTTGFAQFQASLADRRDEVRLVSISIDPEIDTVETLRAYASKYGAGSSWQFLTGSRSAVEAAQRTFGAFRGDKSNHAPLTFFRRSRNAPWHVIDGLSSADMLLRAYRGELAPTP
jgi:cytochrome oxidase Cu insertion factor (SCO1/SenC/PrrC family)